MNKAQLKKLIKPVVKECIQEVLIEDGLLTEVVSQVAAGLQKQPIVEAKKQNEPKERPFDKHLRMRRKSQETNSKLQEHRKRLMEAVGADAYNGVNLFENTEPISGRKTPEGQADLGDSNDPGVDISGLVGNASLVFEKMNGK
jgi:hypothetical protein